ncbi:Sad1-interacting factor 3 [Grifola frondosa]|uniref:Sad1-interacting factor 3 n=1 Tax=Grifola frondosa TaxID=5627 RepID=A0A1C7LUL5_GRIFR|nr:Sad1-interacting factor 3 [Grifola frondosa]
MIRLEESVFDVAVVAQHGNVFTKTRRARGMSDPVDRTPRLLKSRTNSRRDIFFSDLHNLGAVTLRHRSTVLSSITMSNPPASRSSAVPSLHSRPSRSISTITTRPPGRRPSVSGVALTGTINPVTGAPKAQRSSKTTQKLVLLPSAPQTKPLPPESGDEPLHGYETDRGIREQKSAGERMSKEQRESAGYRRITAYCVAQGFRMKLLANFLKREHNVHPRMFDEAMYTMYHLPLLPGYSPGSNIRSSAPPVSPGAEDPSSGLSEAEEDGYQGTYFSSVAPPLASEIEGYIPSTSPMVATTELPEAAQAVPQESQERTPEQEQPRKQRRKLSRASQSSHEFAEAIFFAYGVVVFFGMSDAQEHGIIEDLDAAGIMERPLSEDDWEVEACHYTHDPNIAFPRIYNDFFTFKTHSHLLQLSVAHALAQSTLLAHYETHAHRILSSPRTMSIPQQLASTGVLALSRKDALRLTGRLFTLRRDVNLVSNVLDVPELFWDEASLKALYDAVREYMEIGPRVQVLNEKLAVAEDLLGAIHDHLNNNAMDRITWIIIWLIVAACLVEVGEVIARLVVHATMESGSTPAVASSVAASLSALSREEALAILERIAGSGQGP